MIAAKEIKLSADKRRTEVRDTLVMPVTTYKNPNGRVMNKRVILKVVTEVDTQFVSIGTVDINIKELGELPMDCAVVPFKKCVDSTAEMCLSIVAETCDADLPSPQVIKKSPSTASNFELEVVNNRYTEQLKTLERSKIELLRAKQSYEKAFETWEDLLINQRNLTDEVNRLKDRLRLGKEETNAIVIELNLKANERTFKTNELERLKTDLKNLSHHRNELEILHQSLMNGKEELEFKGDEIELELSLVAGNNRRLQESIDALENHEKSLLEQRIDNLNQRLSLILNKVNTKKVL